MYCAIPALDVVDFDTITHAADRVSCMVLHAMLPNGQVAEIGVTYDLASESVTVTAAIHAGEQSAASPTAITLSPLCTSFPMLNASPACVS